MKVKGKKKKKEKKKRGRPRWAGLVPQLGQPAALPSAAGCTACPPRLLAWLGRLLMRWQAALARLGPSGQVLGWATHPLGRMQANCWSAACASARRPRSRQAAGIARYPPGAIDAIDLKGGGQPA
jgi:hypothetical protein